MNNKIHQHIVGSKAAGRKLFAILVDPDHFDIKAIETAEECNVDYLMIGGSLLTSGKIDDCVDRIRKITNIPVLLFPGSTLQLTQKADAILLLSLISGRNPELLIGKHVEAAPFIKSSGIEVLPTGYILIEGGNATSVAYMSNTLPIPYAKPEIAACTALAGEQLGLKLIYLEAGSGALYPVSTEMINAVNKEISLPIIVGGGINSSEKALAAFKAGADMVVVGTAAENKVEVIRSITTKIKEKA